jgi:formimidoylglutamate deiminase
MAGLALDQRADFVVVDTASPALAGVPQDHLLDAIVFSSPDARFAQVHVAGREVAPPDVRPGFVEAMAALWA